MEKYIMALDQGTTSSQRDFILHKLERSLKFAVRDQTDIALTVGMRRTCQYARRSAVTRMVGKQQLKVCLSGFDDTIGIGVYDHARCDFCCTCFAELRIAVHFTHT